MHNTTRLDAINTMLETVGAEPVNTLAHTSNQDVMVARRTLDAVVREIQAEEFYFNTEEGNDTLSRFRQVASRGGTTFSY